MNLKRTSRTTTTDVRFFAQQVKIKDLPEALRDLADALETEAPLVPYEIGLETHITDAGGRTRVTHVTVEANWSSRSER